MSTSKPNLDRLTVLLNQSGLQGKDPLMYQILNNLIGTAVTQQQIIDILKNQVNPPSGSGGLITTMPAGTLVGRRSSSSGAPEVISVSTGLVLSGTALFANLQHNIVTISNAEFLTVPTTPIDLVPAQGPNSRIQ